MKYWQVEKGGVAALIVSDVAEARIEMWSSHRLPFEPRGVLLDARNELRRNLRDLIAQCGWILDCKYVSLSQGFVDTENVLVYNVGPAYFRSAARFGLKFQRESQATPSSPNNDRCWSHYHSYILRSNQTIDFPPESAQLKIQMRLPHLRTTLKPHDYWWAAKQAMISCASAINGRIAPFRMAATITGPVEVKNCASLLKPLFDGIISSFYFDSSVRPIDLVSQLVAIKLGISPEQVACLLCDSSNCFLGLRRVVAPYRDFVKWNPADELCVDGQLLVRTHNTPDWTIEVDIWTLPLLKGI